jgi:hypothetical protein
MLPISAVNREYRVSFQSRISGAHIDPDRSSALVLLRHEFVSLLNVSLRTLRSKDSAASAWRAPPQYAYAYWR